MWYGWLNRMGPVNREFLEKNGNGWAGGRIDMDCNDEKDPNYDRYGREYSAPIMKTEDWNMVSDWLSEKEWATLPIAKQIWCEFKKETGHNITWYNYEPTC